jgi:2-amino-4-hydroxy-6-hydroxymethyldihydropteridine diphosphokinase/dihydropteroate synthase
MQQSTRAFPSLTRVAPKIYKALSITPKAPIRRSSFHSILKSPNVYLKKPNVGLALQITRHHVHVAAKEHRVFIALGSNMGDRVAMIEEACKEMETTGKIKLVRTSSLWDTKAMYVEDQDNFVNGVCEVTFPHPDTCAWL